MAPRPDLERASDTLGSGFAEDVLDSMDDGVVVVDRDGRAIALNQAAEALFGVSRAAAVGAPLAAWLPRGAALAALAARCLGSGLSCADSDVPLEGRRGQRLSASVVCSPLTRGDGSAAGAVLVIRDQARLKALEGDVRRAERLTTWRTLAAGLAHEVKNPLGGIKGAAQLLRDELRRQPALAPLGEYVEVMIREVSRIDRLLTDLLAFSEPPPPRFAPVNLNGLLDGILLLQGAAEARGEVTIVKEFDPSLPEIRADAEQLTQVFVNLIKNAFEAMAGRGTLRVVSRVDTDYRIRRAGGAGDHGTQVVAVDISDTGPGIPPADLPRLFTPFFTTKPRGTGLGLALSHGIVHAHRGSIAVRSEPGRGTTVTTWLPVAPDGLPAEG
ncbi:MAG TPA: ATP-binding protein [Thermodesulfobacteriota bacterium]|nr:ATP-binding protein [Thermodesulfobacteriota bacterium]